MKKQILLIAAFTIAAVLPSCEKAAGLLFQPFESPLNFNVALSSSAAGETKTLGSTVVSYNLDSEIKTATQNKFGADFITQMYINQIAISLTNSTQTNNLSNFESISLSVSSSGGTPVVLGPFAIPSTATTSHSVAVTNSPNIRPYFNGQNVTFSIIGKTKTATTITLQANVGATIKFDK
ncbi:MAG TPA: hypothetical protein VF622_17345 [Segetibacter sp.]|jgi:hypothetical protein